MTEPARELFSCAAALLDQGRTIDRLSGLITVVALASVLFHGPIAPAPSAGLVGCAALVALAGLFEIYLAIRVGFDAALFHQVASATAAPDFAGMDAALARLGLLPAATSGRPADARIAGARRLFGLQVLALVAQIVLVSAWAVMALMRN